MKSRTMVYPSNKDSIRATWMAPRPPGWTSEGGWLTFDDEEIDGGAITIYIDREQVLRLQTVIADLLAGMPAPGGPPMEHVAESPGKPPGKPSWTRIFR